MDVEWQHKPSQGRLRGPQREFSFLVNERFDPGIGLPGEGVKCLGKGGHLWTALVRSRRSLKTWRRALFALPVVLITASGLLG